MLRIPCTTLSLAGLFLIQTGIAGCQYNGALNLNPNEKKAAVEYQKLLEQRQVQKAEGELAQRRQTAVQFQDTAAAHQPFAHGEYGPGYSTGTPATAVLGLYGVVDRPIDPRVSPLDGQGNLHRLTATLEGADFDPDVDPSGRLIAYASTRHRETADIYVKAVTGTAVTQITNDPADDVMPTFSPDGSKVAFASRRTGNWDIFVMDARGGQTLQITSDPTHDIHPSFSPDGRRLVYSSYGASSGQWEIVVVDLENPGTRRIITTGLFPEWHPTRDTIVFQRARERGTRWFSVWTIDLVDGEAGPPTELAASQNAACITPSWSADGRHIVFCTVIDPGAEDTLERPRQADVWVMNADGSQRSKLTSSQFANLQPTWSPDGSIVFVSNRGPEGSDNVWSLRPDRAVALADGYARQGGPEYAKQPESEGKDSTAVAPTDVP